MKANNLKWIVVVRCSVKILLRFKQKKLCAEEMLFKRLCLVFNFMLGTRPTL